MKISQFLLLVALSNAQSQRQHWLRANSSAATPSPIASSNYTEPATPSPIEDVVVVPNKTCNYIKLSSESEEGRVVFRSPDHCWSTSLYGAASDVFTCQDGILTYQAFNESNCALGGGNALQTVDEVEVGFLPEGEVSADFKVEEWNCEESQCYAKMNGHNERSDCSGDVIGQMYYAAGVCTYESMINADVRFDCCDDDTSMQFSAWDDDYAENSTTGCSGDPTSVSVFEHIYETDTCSNLNGMQFSFDFQWNCTGAPKISCDESARQLKREDMSPMEVAMVVIFAILAFSGVAYCAYSGRELEKNNVQAKLLQGSGDGYQATI